MKYLYIKNFVIIIAVLTLSCSKEKTYKNEIYINIENKTENLSFYEHFEKVSIIPLETNDYCLIGEVTRKFYHDSIYYIFDRTQNCVFVFNDVGKFLFKINRIGKGPGEYTNIVDFDINKYTKSIDVLTPYGEVLKYNKKNGEFISSYHLPENIRAVHFFKALTKDITVFFQWFENNKIILYSLKKEKILNEQHEVPYFVYRYLPSSHYTSPFHIINEKLHLFEFYSNTVHVLEKGALIPKYIWDFGKYNFDIEGIKKNKNRQYYYNYLENNNHLVHLFLSYLENNRYVITQFKFREFFYTLIYSKKNNEYIILDKFKEGVYFPIYPSYMDETRLFVMVQLSEIKYYITDEMISTNKIDIQNNIKNDENPIIIKYTLL